MAFLAPLFLGLLLLVPALWFWPSRLRDRRLGILRTLLFVLLILAAARPVAFHDEGAAWHVVVVDRSASVAADLGHAAAALAAQVPVDDRRVLVQIGEQPASLAMAGQEPQDDAETATSEALGAELATLTPERRQQLGLDDTVDGVLVLDVKEMDPRGLRPGDVIKKIGETEVSTPRAVDGAVSEAREKGRESVLLVVNRQGHDLFVGLKLPVA